MTLQYVPQDNHDHTLLGQDNIAEVGGEDDRRSTEIKNDLERSGTESKDDLEGSWSEKDSFERMILDMI